MKANINLKARLFLFVPIIILLASCSKEDEWDPMDPDPVITGFVGSIDAGTLQADIQWLENMGTRFALNDDNRQIAVGIMNRFISYGYTQVKLDSFYLNCEYDGEYYESWQYNVIATLTGSSAPDSICLIGAHYDCINDEGDPFINAPGANDNASGVSSILEIARVMRLKNYVPRTTIRFIAFAAEEFDLNGSADYAGKAENQGQKIRMMLNMDMIAYEPSSDPSQWTVNIMDYSNSKNLRSCAGQVAGAYTSLSPTNDNSWNEDSDSYSFYQRGFEALFFTCYSDDPNYHTANDLSSDCNFEYCAQITRLSCALLLYYNQL